MTFPRSILTLLILVGGAASPSIGQAADGPVKASWIWSEKASDGQNLLLRQTFDVAGPIKAARVAGTCDNGFTLYLNGTKLLNSDSWEQPVSADATKAVRTGKNVIAVEGTNEGNTAGFLAAVQVTSADGKVQIISSDGTWRTADKATGDWKAADFDASSWKTAKVMGPLGLASLPWSNALGEELLTDMLSGDDGATYKPRLAKDVVVVDGFQVEKVYHVPRMFGSWVSLTNDGKGHLLASDQGGAGLYQITPAKVGDPEAVTTVEKLPVEISSVQGMVAAFDALYVIVNGPDSGLYRLTDTNSDGKVDAKEFLMPVPGGGEHGPARHRPFAGRKIAPMSRQATTPTYPRLSGAISPQNWGEDLILPRRWDANGHAVGRMAPGGWIANVDPSGENWNIFSMGFRNEYDIAFNADGELFTYDADMEWDLGSPWYRPTRICHATSGSEFGWRAGTGKWPTYYQDSLPPVVDIGPGSPVGTVFGYGAKFPAKYQKAFFALDWTYGTIHAIHMRPEGSSYVGVKEDFVYGKPLPVTDAVVGSDGAFYFTAGGRGTLSDLYRVTYVGNESTALVNGSDTAGADLRKLRHELEAFHGKPTKDVASLFKSIGHPDRFVRYAARIAVESQPVDSWRKLALEQTEPWAVINAMIALARQGKPADRPAVLAALGRLNMATLDEAAQSGLLRAYELAFIRLGEPTEQERAKTGHVARLAVSVKVGYAQS